MTELKPCPFCGREAEIIAETKRNIGFTIWCESMELDIDEIFQMNINKLKARYPEGFDPDKANHRRTDDI